MLLFGGPLSENWTNNVQYLGNGSRYEESYYYSLIRSQFGTKIAYLGGRFLGSETHSVRLCLAVSNAQTFEKRDL